MSSAFMSGALGGVWFGLAWLMLFAAILEVRNRRWFRLLCAVCLAGIFAQSAMDVLIQHILISAVEAATR